MLYEKESQKIDELIEKALRNEEIQNGANRAGIKIELLSLKIKEKPSKILEAATKEIEFLNNLMLERQIVEEKLSTTMPSTRSLNFLKMIKPWIIAVLIIIVIVYIISRYLVGWSFVFSLLIAYLPPIFFSVVIAAIMLYKLYTVSEKKFKRDFDAKRKDLEPDIMGLKGYRLLFL
jgi:hypothetical protein